MTAKLSLQSSDEASAIAGDWVETHCRQAGLAQTLTFQVITCVMEAVNNCVEHAYEDTTGEISIRLFHNTRWLVVQVCDRGASLDRQPTQTEPDPLQIDGRGWFIMKQWMDVAQYRRRHALNIVTLAKCLE
jgi:anti-sigma regulatory factor (Ser/Thr protein kinase)